MTAKDKLEDRLEQLGQAIGSDDLLVGNVMSRIDAEPIDESSKIDKLKNKLIIRRFIMSRFTKLAAAAVIIIVVVFSITFLDKSVAPAYAITDIPELLHSAKTLYIKAWSYFPEDVQPGQVQRRVALEHWFDLENGLSRMMGPGYSITSEGTTLQLTEVVSDGQYEMTINHYDKSVTFQKLSPFKQKLDMYQNVGDLFTRMFGSLDRLDDFVKIGQEVIDGVDYDIWQFEVENPAVNYSAKFKSWLSPNTGRLGHALVWLKEGDKDWAPTYEIRKIERDIDIASNIFATEPPEGYALVNTRDNAQISELCREGSGGINGLSISINIGFTLPDGSVIAAWHSEDKNSDTLQVSIFEGLQVGGPLPKLPIEIYSLIPVGTSQTVTYKGRHLLYSKKAGKFYEWGIYVPDQAPFSRIELVNYQALIRFNPPGRVKGSIGLGISRDLTIENEHDFNTWVLGAMVELSDNGKAPEDVTYESVLQLAKWIRKSLVE